eukprot:11162785-Lingulodinium_polyedra.AAC.1
MSWGALWEPPFRDWLRDTALGKRWLSPEGRQWRIPRAATSYNAANCSLKLLAGGVSSAARGIAKEAR